MVKKISSETFIKKALDRIGRNIKLTIEAITVIGSEISKILLYWTCMWIDTRNIYSVVKNLLKKFKKKLWK